MSKYFRLILLAVFITLSFLALNQHQQSQELVNLDKANSSIIAIGGDGGI